MDKAHVFRISYRRGILSFTTKIVTKDNSYEEAERMFFAYKPEGERINSISYEGKVVISDELLGQQH